MDFPFSKKSEEPVAPSTQPPSPENPALQPLPKNPYDQKWWQFPKTFYIVLAVVLIVSLGLSAYLLFAPSGIFNTPSGSQSSTGPIYGPSAESTPTPTTGVILVGTVTPEPNEQGTPTPTPDPTVGWRTYTNQAYNYSFRYPPDWTVTDLGNLEPKVPSYLTVNPSSVSTPSANLGITVGSSFRTFDEELALRSSARAMMTINGLQASRTEEKDSNGNISFNVVLKGINYTYILVGKKAYESTFNLIYPTFKLL